jgi:hypothetical protein
MNEPAMSLHAPDQVQIFKERVRAASAHSVVNRPPDENTRITVAQSKPSQVGINRGHLPRGIVFALKNQRKITADNGTASQRVPNRFERSGFRAGIGVYEPQDIAFCLSRCGSKLAATAALACHYANSQFRRNGCGTVFAASVSDQDLLLARQRLQCLEGFGDRCLFVQRWHKNTYHVTLKLFRMQVVNAPAPSHLIC